MCILARRGKIRSRDSGLKTTLASFLLYSLMSCFLIVTGTHQLSAYTATKWKQITAFPIASPCHGLISSPPLPCLCVQCKARHLMEPYRWPSAWRRCIAPGHCAPRPCCSKRELSQGGMIEAEIAAPAAGTVVRLAGSAWWFRVSYNWLGTHTDHHAAYISFAKLK